VTIGGEAYPNGRNQESVSEAIAAYEAVALLGEVLSHVFHSESYMAGDSVDGGLLRGSDDDDDQSVTGRPDSAEVAMHDTANFIRDMGRLLMCTEIRSTRTYWQVRFAQDYRSKAPDY